MSVPSELSGLIQNAKAAVAAHPRHELILPLRQKIWAALGAINTNQGLYRRYYLGRMCVQKVLKFWHDGFSGDTLIDDVIKLADDYLRTQTNTDREQLHLKWTKLKQFLDRHMLADDIRPIYTAWAAVRLIALIFEKPSDTEDTQAQVLDDDLTLFSWGASYYAAAAFSGEIPSEEDCDKEKLKTFWDWYLDEAVSRAWLSAQPIT